MVGHLTALWRNLFRKERIDQELDEEICNAIAGLAPTAVENFTVLQAQRLSLYIPIQRVMADITLGGQAKAQLDGEPVKGIL